MKDVMGIIYTGEKDSFLRELIKNCSKFPGTTEGFRAVIRYGLLPLSLVLPLQR